MDQATIVALAALAFAIVSLGLQERRAWKHATANVKPLLAIRSLNFEHHKAIKLVNYGLGPAIIKKVRFSKGGRTTDRVVDLFDQLAIGKWERFQNLPKDRAVPPQAKIVLVEQTLPHLLKHNEDYKRDDGLALLAKWKKLKSGIEVYVEYKDIFDNDMTPLTDTLN